MLPTPARLTEIVPPGAEPVTLDEAKAHLRERSSEDDILIRALISAAREMCEAFAGRALITRTYSLFLDAWPEGGIVVLPRPPLAGVVSIQTYGENDVAVSVPAPDYFVDAASLPARVGMRTSVPPPCATRALNGIEIRYRAGYGAAPSDVPEVLRQGVLRLVAHLYQHRGDDDVSSIAASGAAALLQPYRILST